MGGCGSYLKLPHTEKISTDEASDNLKCAASSMQGWRVTQEDAHNCLLDFDVNTSLFAVYDGHGGHEVAEYCSKKLPDYIKQTEAYKSGDYEKALIDAFLGFDATIATPEVVVELKEIAEAKEEGENDNSSSDVEENVNNLYEEASMPLEQVIKKYTSSLKDPNLLKLQKDGEKLPVSPFLRAKKDKPDKEAAGSSASGEGSSGSSNNAETTSEGQPNTNDLTADKKSNDAASSHEPEKNGTDTQAAETKVEKSSVDSKNNNDKILNSHEDAKSTNVDIKAGGEPNQNGEVESLSNEKSPDSTTPQENGDIVKKGKGKALTKTKGAIKTPEKKIRPKRNAHQLYNKLLEFESEESESEDDEDKTFREPTDSSSDDGEELEESEDDEEEMSEIDEEDLEDAEEEEGLSEAHLEFARNMREEPGSDSGCTAVVALLHENQLFVANAGDSRCVVCRNGQAIEMSFDHKPEDKQESQRIVKAGGEVTGDGRVNGGLNLSRAIGDHAYKQNKELSDREQMITALPDVRTLTISPSEDEFIVLACDGIWNSMSSQQVVNLVKDGIQKSSEKLSQIIEQMFERCLASNTMGDGTGCDNMTAIIVQFKSNSKRAAPADEIEEPTNAKRAKTEETLDVNKLQAESTA